LNSRKAGMLNNQIASLPETRQREALSFSVN
jgi:hypothetical protein